MDKKMAALAEEMAILAKQKEVIDIATADRVKAIDKIFSPSSSNNGEAVASNLKEDDAIQKESNATSKEIATLGKIIKIKKIPIDQAEYDLDDFAVVINYGRYDVAIGTTMRIIESYRIHAIESYQKLTPSSDESLRLTVDMPCNEVIESTWKKFFSSGHASKTAFTRGDNDIINLYGSIRGAELTYHFNPKNHFLKNYTTDSIICTKEKITIKTTAMDGDLSLDPDVKDGSMDRMVTVLDGDGQEVVIGTIYEISNSYDKNHKNRESTVGVDLFPKVPKVSATKKSIDSYWSKLTVAELHLSRNSKIDHYCNYYYSNRGTELVNSNFMVDEHELAIDETFNPSLSIYSYPGLPRLGEDVVDGNEHKAVIGATTQEYDICS